MKIRVIDDYVFYCETIKNRSPHVYYIEFYDWSLLRSIPDADWTNAITKYLEVIKLFDPRDLICDIGASSLKLTTCG
jgi:hypothetical protein